MVRFSSCCERPSREHHAGPRHHFAARNLQSQRNTRSHASPPHVRMALRTSPPRIALVDRNPTDCVEHPLAIRCVGRRADRFSTRRSPWHARTGPARGQGRGGNALDRCIDGFDPNAKWKVHTQPLRVVHRYWSSQLPNATRNHRRQHSSSLGHLPRPSRSNR